MYVYHLKECFLFPLLATDEVGVGLALHVTTPLLSALTAVSLVTACTLALTLYRAKRKKTGTYVIDTSCDPQTLQPQLMHTHIVSVNQVLLNT